MEKGKHVLCEKLMAKTVRDCKRMVRAARKTGKLLSIGHQRHYSYLYANALEVVRQKDILGDVRHIRAFWHRNQTGGGKPGADKGEFDTWFGRCPPEDQRVDFAQYGYKSLDELVRWRLSTAHRRGADGRTRQPPAGRLQHPAERRCSAARRRRSSAGGFGRRRNSFFTDGREVEDHVFLTYEYPKDVVVTYSSITTNELDAYGEQVMGTRGTLAMLDERDVYLFKEKALKDTRVTWAERRIGQPSAVRHRRRWAAGAGTAGHARQPRVPRGAGAPGLADPPPRQAASRAATARSRWRTRWSRWSRTWPCENRRIEFKPEWFDVNSDAAPA